MDSESYWSKRAEEREAQWYAKSQQTIEKELADYYLQAASRIRNDIAVLYARFAADNGIDKAAAQQLIQGDEYRVWRMEMKDYLKQVQVTGDKKLLMELNTLAMRSRISRLDKIYGDTMMECAKLAEKVDARMGIFLGDALTDNYYHGIYDIGQKMKIRMPIAAANSEMVDKVLHTPWSGKNYSQRIWKNTGQLAQTIQHEMVDAVHRGSSVQQMSRMVQERMQVGRSDATRLVRTELNYVENQAALDSIRDAGMKYVKFSATLDGRTSEICRQHDGKIIPIEDAKPGVNIPPLHPHCRSTVFGCLKGDSITHGKRAARDVDGKYMRVPADMNYQEWYNKYIEKSTIPSGKGDWKTNRDGTIKESKSIPLSERFRTPPNYEPNGVIRYGSSCGGGNRQVNLALYDSNGFLMTHIHYGNHGFPKKHPYGDHGEHAHDYRYIDGKLDHQAKTTRELSNVERRYRHDN